MFLSHLLLFLLWVLFSALHSIFAAEKIKEKLRAIMKNSSLYYRLFYSVFALLLLSFIVIYNFTIKSRLLWQVNLVEEVIAFAFAFLAFIFMLSFSKKFFFQLSGADVFFEAGKTETLIKTGFYRHVRHPLYTATLMFVWSIFFWQPLLSYLISCICITVYTLIGISFEEKKLINIFGESYRQYKIKTPMLIPKFNVIYKLHQ